MAAAAPLDFNGFLGQIATLGTVNTDGQGFIAAMAYALPQPPPNLNIGRTGPLLSLRKT